MILGIILDGNLDFTNLTTSTPPTPTQAWLESYGSHLQFGTELPRFEGSYQPSEFL